MCHRQLFPLCFQSRRAATGAVTAAAVHHGYPLVNLVRSERGAAVLRRRFPSVPVVSTSDPGWTQWALVALGGRPRVVLDAVGGALATQLIGLLENGGTFIAYGLLSGEPLVSSTTALIGRELRIRGVSVGQWPHRRTPELQASDVEFAVELARTAPELFDVAATRDLRPLRLPGGSGRSRPSGKGWNRSANDANHPSERNRVMRIGMLGVGQVAQAVASHSVAAGHEVVLSNRRGPAFIASVVDQLGPKASAGTPAEAAQAELVLLAVRWTDVPDALTAAGVEDWQRRIVIDATNQFIGNPPHLQNADLGDITGSEHIATMLAGARVVKAFNTLYASYIAADPRHPAGRQIVFLAGDDSEANCRVAWLVEEFGFAAVNLGGLRKGGRLMQIGGPLSGLHALKQD